MPPSFYCKPRWIKAGGRSTGHSLAPSTQIQFMNNQSKKCLSEQHCGPAPGFLLERASNKKPRQAPGLGKGSGQLTEMARASMKKRALPC